ncbi:MAG: YihA family ribosome biogenesis GTP-binding protein [Clostridia bacterium]|nr:YihA family ribosome biogenesis GTP-binding protein [Clostridia bacterium]
MEIKRAAFVTSMAAYGRFAGIGLPQIAVAGKSNVGKSSLINALCRNGKLAKTSATPGKTRMLNVFEINGGTGDAFHLVDLPGYGFAKVDKAEKLRWGEMMQGYFENAAELKLVLQLVDIRHDPTQDDIDMVAFLRSTGAPFQVVATKADKVARGSRMKYTAPICRALQVQPWELIAFSSETGEGRDALLRAIEQAVKA